MNVYDFDNTIYNGDSTIDFSIFLIKKRPSIICFLTRYSYMFILYFLGYKSKKEVKQRLFGYLKYITNIDEKVDEFWSINQKKLYSWYIMQHREDDVIISASPEFLLTSACRILKVKCLIASKVDKTTGVIIGENCSGEEKVKRFRELYKNDVIENFYSDSLSDLPLARISKSAYLVNRGRVKTWPMGKR